MFIRAYLFTVLIELVLCYLLNHEIGFMKILGADTLVNTFSVPIVWFLLTKLPIDYFTFVVVAEVFAVASEGLLLKTLLPRSLGRSMVTSVAMNITSFSIGVLFPWLFAPIGLSHSVLNSTIHSISLEPLKLPSFNSIVN
jgi:hypothetical protein